MDYTYKAGGRIKTLMEGVEAEGWRFVAFVRLVPLFPFNLLNYALGLIRKGMLALALLAMAAFLPRLISRMRRDKSV